MLVANRLVPRLILINSFCDQNISRQCPNFFLKIKTLVSNNSNKERYPKKKWCQAHPQIKKPLFFPYPRSLSPSPFISQLIALHLSAFPPNKKTLYVSHLHDLSLVLHLSAFHVFWFPQASTTTSSGIDRQQEIRKGVFVASVKSCNLSTKAKKKPKSDGNDSNVENLSKKELALQQALDQIITSFGKGSIVWLGRSTSPKQVPVMSTGSFALDIALGVGGFPKLSSSSSISANLLLSQPDYGGQDLSLVDTLIQSGSVDVVVVDGVAALAPKGELDGEMGDAQMAMQARLMSQAILKVTINFSTRGSGKDGLSLGLASLL